MEIESGDEHRTKAMTTRQGPGTGVLDQATTWNPPNEAGQDDDDGDILALSEKRSGKKRGDSLASTAAATAIQGKSASRIGSPASSVPRSRAPASAARSSVLSKTSSSDSDSDSPARPNKRARTKGQDRDGGDDDDDGGGGGDSDDGVKRGELRWRGTKQPVKRVGRRF
jgi:hypothetical protein